MSEERESEVGRDREEKWEGSGIRSGREEKEMVRG